MSGERTNLSDQGSCSGKLRVTSVNSKLLADTDRPDIAGVAGPASRRGRRLKFIVAAASLGVIASLLAAEVGLRLVGVSTWKYPFEPGRPIVNEPDTDLGWRNKTGHYVAPPYASGNPPIIVTHWSEGRRATAPQQVARTPAIAIVGCSFTHGWAISDSETYAWKLQQQFPAVEVRNYGTPGYGTYQCLLVMEKLFASATHPQIVVYGFYEHHEARNVAESSWLQVVEKCSRRGEAGLPYCTLDADGRLTRHAAVRYPTFPLHEHLALSVLAERVYLKWSTSRNAAQSRPVTEKLVLEMDALCKTHGAKFVLAFLKGRDDLEGGPGLSHYADYCRSRGIRFVDCVHPFTNDMMVPGEGHPNGRMNDLWAADIANALREVLPSSFTHTGPCMTTAPNR